MDRDGADELLPEGYRTTLRGTPTLFRIARAKLAELLADNARR
jgi:hypothetical protein